MSDYNDGNGVVISRWDVPNVQEPTHEEILAMDTPDLEIQFQFLTLSAVNIPLLAQFVDSVARQKQYNDAVSCASYFNSTNIQWKNEATTFIAWRDAVYTYVIAQYALMQSGQRAIPSWTAFQSELPVITWPD